MVKSKEHVEALVGPYKLGWHDKEEYVFKPKKGLSEEIVREMSEIKGEPAWMTTFRIRALKRFSSKPMKPWFAVNMPDLDFDDIYYYVKPTEGQVNSWEELPESVRNTYEKLGIPEAERKYLAGVTAQYECLTGDSQVYTERGMVEIKSIRENDVVYCVDEQSLSIKKAKVRGLKFSGFKKVYEIKANSSSIKASSNHPFLVLSYEMGKVATKWKRLDELKVGDLIGMSLKSNEELYKGFKHLNYFKQLQDKKHAFYLFGLILNTEGVSLGPNNEIEFADKNVFELVRGNFYVEGSEGTSSTIKKEWIELFSPFLSKPYGVTKYLPSFVKALGKEELSSFIKGSLRLDISENLNQQNPNLTEKQFKNFGIGFPPKFIKGELGFFAIESILSSGMEPTYDIEVEGYHNFIAEGFLVHNSEVVYHKNRQELEAQGVIFLDMDSAVKQYPELVKKYFGTVIPPADNKFAALNSAVWSGGSFIYVPPGVQVEMPLQAYFRINAENMGQFERTLIIADQGSSVHYVEGCSAPIYSSSSLHSAVVELVALEGARITYTTIQNWSTNVYNLVTKRARAEAEARVEWIDGNIGSKLTMKYPSVFLMGPKASGEVLSVAYAGKYQHQDAGAKMHHCAPETSSTIISKSISKDGGKTTYRGKVEVLEGATGSKSYVRCDALLLDDFSISETKPTMEVKERDASIGHEATVAKIGDDQVYYLMSRGLSESQAMSLVVNGFIEPITKTLPLEYAVEWSRLIELQMEGAIG